MIIFKNRIMHSRFRTVVVLFIFFWPSFEIFYYLHNISLGASIPNPDYACFLTVNSAGIGHLFQSLWFWFMPFYLTLLFGELCIEDFQTGYYQIIVSKTGNRQYILSYMRCSFLFGAMITFAALMFNFMLVHIMFSGGMSSPYSIAESDSSWLLFQYEHSSIINLFFILITSCVVAVLAVFCTMAALIFQSRKTVYAINVILWLIFILRKNSIVLLFQPFSEYSIDTLISIGIVFCICYLLAIIVLYILGVYKRHEISLV